MTTRRQALINILLVLVIALAAVVITLLATDCLTIRTGIANGWLHVSATSDIGPIYAGAWCLGQCVQYPVPGG